MPQGNSNYYKSKTKTQTVKCRVCLAVCLAHTYQSHLKKKLTEENASDLRRYGEVSLAFTMNRIQRGEKRLSWSFKASRCRIHLDISCWYSKIGIDIQLSGPVKRIHINSVWRNIWMDVLYVIHMTNPSCLTSTEIIGASLWRPYMVRTHRISQAGILIFEVFPGRSNFSAALEVNHVI